MYTQALFYAASKASPSHFASSNTSKLDSTVFHQRGIVEISSFVMSGAENITHGMISMIFIHLSELAGLTSQFVNGTYQIVGNVLS